MPLVFTISGDAEIKRNIDAIAAGIREDAIRAALVAAGETVVGAAKALCVEETGALRKSIGLIYREQKRRRPAYVVIGAQRGPAFEGIGPDGRKRVPANYAHLVEFGHLVVEPRKGTSIRGGDALLASGRSFVGPRPFLRPAIAGSAGAVRAAFIAALTAFHARASARSRTFHLAA